jgi:hypothetical protein
MALPCIQDPRRGAVKPGPGHEVLVLPPALLDDQTIPAHDPRELSWPSYARSRLLPWYQAKVVAGGGLKGAAPPAFVARAGYEGAVSRAEPEVLARLLDVGGTTAHLAAWAVVMLGLPPPPSPGAAGISAPGPAAPPPVPCPRWKDGAYRIGWVRGAIEQWMKTQGYRVYEEWEDGSARFRPVKGGAHAPVRVHYNAAPLPLSGAPRSPFTEPGERCLLVHTAVPDAIKAWKRYAPEYPRVLPVALPWLLPALHVLSVRAVPSSTPPATPGVEYPPFVPAPWLFSWASGRAAAHLFFASEPNPRLAYVRESMHDVPVITEEAHVVRLAFLPDGPK